MILITKDEGLLIQACRFTNKDTKRIDRVIGWWAKYTGNPVDWFKPDLLPYLLVKVQELYVKIHGVEHFLDMQRECYKDNTKFEFFNGDSRCNRNSEVAVYFATLYYWTTKFALVSNKKFIVGEMTKQEPIKKSNSSTITDIQFEEINIQKNENLLLKQKI